MGTAEGRPRKPDGERLGGFVSGHVSCPLGLGVGMVPRFGRAMLLSLVCHLDGGDRGQGAKAARLAPWPHSLPLFAVLSLHPSSAEPHLCLRGIKEDACDAQVTRHQVVVATRPSLCAVDLMSDILPALRASPSLCSISTASPCLTLCPGPGHLCSKSTSRSFRRQGFALL